MVDSDVFVQALESLGVNFFTGVPDSLLGGIIEELLTRKLYTSAVREDEAVAMAAGAFMAGKIPAVLMQNSGLGTSLNTLLSLNMIYRQPCILLVSWRGFDGKDAPEHLVMGETMPQLLDTMKIPHRTDRNHLSRHEGSPKLELIMESILKTPVSIPSAAPCSATEHKEAAP